jgi:hypothetical protein
MVVSFERVSNGVDFVAFRSTKVANPVSTGYPTGTHLVLFFTNEIKTRN